MTAETLAADGADEALGASTRATVMERPGRAHEDELPSHFRLTEHELSREPQDAKAGPCEPAIPAGIRPTASRRDVVSGINFHDNLGRRSQEVDDAEAEFQEVFKSLATQQGRGDAALAAFARATGMEAITANSKLVRFIEHSLGASKRTRHIAESIRIRDIRK